MENLINEDLRIKHEKQEHIAAMILGLAFIFIAIIFKPPGMWFGIAFGAMLIAASGIHLILILQTR